jgi:hypothetical protein
VPCTSKKSAAGVAGVVVALRQPLEVQNQDRHRQHAVTEYLLRDRGGRPDELEGRGEPSAELGGEALEELLVLRFLLGKAEEGSGFRS